MPYIPKEHLKYDLLPFCRENGGEVFEYPSEMLDKVEKYLPDGESLIPYGYNSYEEYYSQLDKLSLLHKNSDEIYNIFIEFKNEMMALNRKEDWSILKYIGESTDVFGLTHGKNYYWPCKKSEPFFRGVIDNEEFTAYQYSTDKRLWEILEDPTGMAHRTLNAR